VKIEKMFVACFLAPLVLAAGTELKLKPIHPQETVAETLNQRFSLENALANIESIKGWLDSFRRLTAAAKGKLTARAWKDIGNTDWETQELAFSNLPPAIEGALRYQNWLLKKARYELALAEMRAARSPAPATEQARREMEQAEKDFREFWDTLAVAD